MGFYALSAAWLALLIPPLVALYFLKLKRPQLEIPSLVLWKQVLEDKRVNSPFQRFKRHILLLLQLLLLALLILAAMQPYWEGTASKGRNTPILIDRSASMAALDKPGGQSRLDAAKAKVREIIHDLGPGHRVALIAFGDTATRLTGFTDDPRELREALDRLEVEHVPSNLGDALRIAQALSQRDPFEEALLYSDGNFPADTDVAQSFRVNYQRLDPAGPNMGVTQLVARRGETNPADGKSGRWDVFVHVEAGGTSAGGTPASLTGTVEVLLDGVVLEGATQLVTVAGGRPERILFPVYLDKPGEVSVRLRPQGFDSLRADDAAAVRLDPARKLTVYVAESLAAYTAALQPVADVRLVTGGTGGVYDLVITDTDDASRVAPVVMHVGHVPRDLAPLLDTTDEGGSVVDWRRDSPLLSHIQFGDVVLVGGPIAKPEVRENSFENLGYEVLVHGQRGPLLVQRREEGRLAHYMLFHSDRSTLPYRVAFPIFLQNLVRVAMHEAGLLEVSGPRTGVLPAVADLKSNESVRVTIPGNAVRDAQADGAGVLAGVAAPTVGQYRIATSGGERIVTANLLDARETGLRGVDQIQFNELAVAAAPAPVNVDQPLWRWLAIVGLAVLLVEWWLFQRDPRGVRPTGAGAIA